MTADDIRQAIECGLEAMAMEEGEYGWQRHCTYPLTRDTLENRSDCDQEGYELRRSQLRTIQEHADLIARVLAAPLSQVFVVVAQWDNGSSAPTEYSHVHAVYRDQAAAQLAAADINKDYDAGRQADVEEVPFHE